MTVEAIQSVLSDDNETELITKGEIYDIIHEDNFGVTIMGDNNERLIFEHKNLVFLFQPYQDLADLVYDYDPGY